MQSESLRNPRTERLLRLPEVERLSGLKKSSIYAMEKKGEFPRHVKLAARAIAWPESAVDAWVAERMTLGATA